jgi:hypothetical protein
MSAGNLSKNSELWKLVVVDDAGTMGIILNSAVKEDENGAGTRKHEGF